MNKIVALLVCSLVSGAGAGAALADTLQGSVQDQAPLEPSRSESLTPQEPMMQPVVPKKPLQGGVQKEDSAPIQGGTEDDGDGLKPMTPRADAGHKKVLQGSAITDDKADPDAEDQELMVQWDKWRNRLLWAIQSGMQETLNNPDDSMLRWDPDRQTLMSRFPLGTSAWFYCQVTPDRHISKIKLVRSSGYPNYDKAVLESVQNLEGSSILKFPARSRRLNVTQIAGIKTSDTAQPHNFIKFGDTERYTVPGQ